MEIERLVTFYCPTCNKTFRVNASIKRPVCTCGSQMQGRGIDPPETDIHQAIAAQQEQDRTI